MRVSIYNEPRGSGIGGSELVAALLAEAFAKDHRVDLYHRIPSLTIEKLAANSGRDVKNVQLHCIDLPIESQLSRRNPLTHFKQSQNFLAGLSEGYDIFIAIMHGVPPFLTRRRTHSSICFRHRPLRTQSRKVEWKWVCLGDSCRASRLHHASHQRRCPASEDV